MPRTIGYHWVKSGYGLWLPGDERGHWSEAWDEQIGYIEPHTLHPGDPVRVRMAQERMRYPPTRLSAGVIRAVADTLERCAAESDWSIAAASIEATHMHVLITYTPREINNTVKWLADQTTKAAHAVAPGPAPVWCKGKWLEFIFEPSHWNNLKRYIERHNERRGLACRPYAFITA